VPQNGAYCAWGLAGKDKLFPVDPKVWRIVDGKLYLNYDKEVQQTWVADTDKFIREADENWPSHTDF